MAIFIRILRSRWGLSVGGSCWPAGLLEFTRVVHRRNIASVHGSVQNSGNVTPEANEVYEEIQPFETCSVQHCAGALALSLHDRSCHSKLWVLYNMSALYISALLANESV